MGPGEAGEAQGDEKPCEYNEPWGNSRDEKRVDVKTVSRWRPRRDAEYVYRGGQRDEGLQVDRKDGVHEVVDVDVNVTVEEAGITRCDL